MAGKKFMETLPERLGKMHKKTPEGVKAQGRKIEEESFFADSVVPAWMRISAVAIFGSSYSVLGVDCSFCISWIIAI